MYNLIINKNIYYIQPYSSQSNTTDNAATVQSNPVSEFNQVLYIYSNAIC